MKILVYTGGEDHPPAYRCAARFLLDKGRLHPVVIHATTPEGAEKAAREWWDGEVAKEQAKLDAAEARRQRKAGVPVNDPKEPPPAPEADEPEETI